MIGTRLKEERERLGYTQDAFAEIVGAKRRALIEWEKGNTSPTLASLDLWGSVGVDVIYVMTGSRESRPVSYYSSREVEDAMHEWLSDAKSLGAIEIDSRQTYDFLLSLYMRNLAKVAGPKSSARSAEERNKKTG